VNSVRFSLHPVVFEAEGEHLPGHSMEWRYAAQSSEDERDGADADLCR
jgi:hypothetical protein